MILTIWELAAIFLALFVLAFTGGYIYETRRLERVRRRQEDLANAHGGLVKPDRPWPSPPAQRLEIEASENMRKKEK